MCVMQMMQMYNCFIFKLVILFILHYTLKLSLLVASIYFEDRLPVGGQNAGHFKASCRQGFSGPRLGRLGRPCPSTRPTGRTGRTGLCSRERGRI